VFATVVIHRCLEAVVSDAIQRNEANAVKSAIEPPTGCELLTVLTGPFAEDAVQTAKLEIYKVVGLASFESRNRNIKYIRCFILNFLYRVEWLSALNASIMIETPSQGRQRRLLVFFRQDRQVRQST